VHRESYREVPPRVEYSMTGFGVELLEALGPLCDWATKHIN
jgi:DNA-binding HxlR family transcriptional regulator